MKNSIKESKIEIEQNIFKQNKFSKTTNTRLLVQQFSHFSKEELFEINKRVSIAGRIINRPRSFDKLIFIDLADKNGIIQLKIFQSRNFVKAGDIVGITGIVCKTDRQNEKKNKDEKKLTIEVEKISFLAKYQRQQSLPDTAYFKFRDIEERFRKRY